MDKSQENLSIDLTQETAADFRARPKPGYPPHALSCVLYTYKEDIVNTQCLDYSRDLIKSYAAKLKSGLIVEIGVLGGATLLDLVEICKENGNKLIGIDPFDEINIYNGVDEKDIDVTMVEQTHASYKFNRENLMHIISKYNLEDIITIIPQSSHDAVSLIDDNSINIIHIDGDHSTEGVYQDLKNYYPKLVNPGGIIIGDDYNWKSVAEGLHRFCLEYDLTYHSFHEKYIIEL